MLVKAAAVYTHLWCGLAEHRSLDLELHAGIKQAINHTINRKLCERTMEVTYFPNVI